MIKITPDEFKVIAQYIYKISGITLDASKAYLVETRLKDLLEEQKCASFSEFHYRVKTDATGAMSKKVIDAISTNETLFFRDASPFELLKNKIIPDLIDRKTDPKVPGKKIPIRVWSAACSTGQEVYSIAMTLREMLPDFTKYAIKIIGTDISNAAVSAASCGKYNKFEIERGLAPGILSKYFTSQGDVWKVKDEVRIMASFKKLNLFDSFASLGKFDIVFCRNVAIYFSVEDRKMIFNKIADILEPDGGLIIGSSEYLSGICDKFEAHRHLRSVFYQLKAGTDSASATPSRQCSSPQESWSKN